MSGDLGTAKWIAAKLEFMFSRNLLRRNYSIDEEMFQESVNGSLFSFSSRTLDESRMRRKLRYFFMNPCQKYSAKRRVPFKLIMQLAKIALVTIQLVLFGLDSQHHAAFVEKNLITFKHLYLNHWDPTLETMPYPPTRGRLAVYTYRDMYDAVNFLLRRYNDTVALALGSYDFPTKPAPPVLMCRTFYLRGEIFADNQSYNFVDKIQHQCVNITPVRNSSGQLEYSMEQFVKEKNISMNFDSILDISFRFSLKSVNLRSIDMDQQPDCYRFDIRVLLDNALHNGEVGVSLSANMVYLVECDGIIKHKSQWGYAARILVTIFDMFVGVVCLISLSLCVRSLHNATRMRSLAIKYFKQCHSHNLSSADRWAFIDAWLVLIIVSDVLVIVGSMIKLLTDNSITDNFQAGGVSLGVGVCLVWCGILRYFGFFGKYNILLRVLSVAMPSMLRFLVCAGVLFGGFTLCGWVVIGAYHVKFKTVESTAACLFSLLNGDDMFVTFSGVSKSRSLFCYYFNYIYLIIFISLFIYAVLNVFITIIIDAYEMLKESGNAEPSTFMWNFIGKRNEPRANPRLYRIDEEDEADCNIGRICSDFFHRICCCLCHAYCRHEDDDSDHEDPEDDDSRVVFSGSPDSPCSSSHSGDSQGTNREQPNESTALLSSHGGQSKAT